MSGTMVKFKLVGLLLIFPTLSFGQECLLLRSLEPVVRGRTAKLVVDRLIGPKIESQNLAQLEAVWVFIKSGQVQENRDSLGDFLVGDHLELPVPAPGPVVVGIEFSPAPETIDPALVPNHDSQVTPQSALTVSHRRSTMVIFDTDWPEKSPDSMVATTETSLSSSIHSLVDPTKVRVGGELAFEAVVQGSKVQNATLMATNLGSGKSWRLKAAGNGIVKFVPESAGQYVIEFQYLRKSDPGTLAKMELFSSTLVVTVQGASK